MKTSNDSGSAPPRFACRVVQGWVSLVGDGAAPPPGAFGSRHVAACACCQDFFNRSTALEATLRSGSAALRAAPSAGLDRRIIAAVRESARPARRAERRFAGGVMAWGGAVAVIAVAFVVVQRQSTSNNGRTGALAVAPTAANDGNDAAAATVWGRLQPDAEALLEGEPLQREVDAFYADARSALGFLALNFLPSQPDEAANRAEQPAQGRRGFNG